MKESSIQIKEMEISSVVENIPLAVDFVEKYVRDAGLPEDEVINCCIVASEAITNAVMHGNNLDKDKKVTIRLSQGKKAICLSVADNGQGFNISELKDPLKAENKSVEHGRGVFIMNSLSDKIRYNFNNDGTEIKIYKRIPGKQG